MALEASRAWSSPMRRQLRQQCTRAPARGERAMGFKGECAIGKGFVRTKERTKYRHGHGMGRYDGQGWRCAAVVAANGARRCALSGGWGIAAWCRPWTCLRHTQGKPETTHGLLDTCHPRRACTGVTVVNRHGFGRRRVQGVPAYIQFGLAPFDLDFLRKFELN